MFPLMEISITGIVALLVTAHLSMIQLTSFPKVR